jgi:hypothetical protein
MQRFATASVLALMAVAGPVHAEVTPQQVWDDFEAYMTSFGYQVSATEEAGSGALTLRDLTMVMPFPEEEASLSIQLSEMTLSETGDGAVSIAYPATTPMLVTVTESGKTSAEMTFDLTQSGLDMVVSGAPDDMLYTYAAEEIGLRMVALDADDETVPSELYEVSFGLGPMQGTQHMLLEDGLRQITQDVALGTLRYALMFEDPDSDDRVELSGSFDGLTSAGAMALPQDADLADPEAFLTSGLMVDMTMAHSGGDNRFTVTEGPQVTEGAFTSRGGELGVSMDAEALTYAIAAQEQTVALAGPELPLPINAALGEFGFSLSMPLAAAETPQPAGLSVLLREFTMADMLWNVFDPGQKLPRDPATVAINLEAEVTPKVSLLDAEKMAEMGESGAMPGELNSLTLSDLAIEAVGGIITGSGAFTFDNSDLTTFDGLPRPKGEVNLSIGGANGLIDTLIAMGLMQEQDAMGARMMLGMFTVPGSEPDTATSKIEINEEGHVLANGQRIK